MPTSPAIPNIGGAYGLRTGADDPFNQFDGPSGQLGVYNLYNPKAGFPSALRKFRHNWVTPGPLQIVVSGDSIAQGFGGNGVTIPFSHRLHQFLFNFTALADGGLGLMLPFWAGTAGSGVTATGSSPASNFTGTGCGVSSTAVNVVGTAQTFTFNTNNVTWCTGTNKVQVMDILYIDTGIGATDITYKIDGGALQTLTIAKTGDNKVKKVTIPAGAAPAGLTNAVHSVEIGSSFLTVSLVGVICYASASGATGVMVHNAGCGGTTLQAQMASGTATSGLLNASATDYLSVINPNLVVVHVGVNDTINPSQAIYSADVMNAEYNTLAFSINLKATLADMIWIGPPAINMSAIQGFYQRGNDNPGIEKQMQNYANTYNFPLLLLRACWGDFSTYAASGLTSDTLIHPNQNGHDDIAYRLHRILMAA